MQRAIKTYLIVSNVLAALLLAFISEQSNEAVEVISWHAAPVLKQTHDDNDKQVHVGEGKQQQHDDEKARASLGRILAKARTEAMRIMTEVRIIAAWLFVNAVLSWWFFGTRHRVEGAGTVAR